MHVHVRECGEWTELSFLDGVSGGHHDTSHHQNDQNKLAAYQKINLWHVSQYAYLLEKLSAMKEGDQSVLDNSMILYGSGLRDGDSHNRETYLFCLAEEEVGGSILGSTSRSRSDTPLANLYAGLLHAFGCGIDRFADSTEMLPGLLSAS